MAESPIQSSFIPHDAAGPARVSRRSSGLYDLIMLVSIVLFVASAVLAVGVYLYQQVLQSESNSKKQQLQKAKAAFEPALIQKLTRLDDRMQAADQLLSTHLAPSSFLTVLGQVTLQTVSFASLDFQASDPTKIMIKMDGIAQSVNSIALQADLFSKSTVITSPIFSGINRQVGGVHFNVAALINPAFIKYSQKVEGQAAGAALPEMQETASTTAPASPFEPAPAAPPAKK